MILYTLDNNGITSAHNLTAVFLWCSAQNCITNICKVGFELYKLYVEIIYCNILFLQEILLFLFRYLLNNVALDLFAYSLI